MNPLTFFVALPFCADVSVVKVSRDEGFEVRLFLFHPQPSSLSAASAYRVQVYTGVDGRHTCGVDVHCFHKTDVVYFSAR